MGVVRKLKKLISIPQVFTIGRNDYKEKKIVQYLRQWNAKLQQDEVGNLYLINPGTPLLCAHMDTRQSVEACVHNSIPGTLNIKNGILKTGKCLGADDKCGIAIAMQLYEDLGDEISLLFTVQEESGLHGARHFVENHKTLLDMCLYCVIPDRMGETDVIGFGNDYCSLDFQSKLVQIANEQVPYRPAHGVCCDANVINSVLNCVNMSCGYMNHHTDNEEVNIVHFYNAYAAIYDIVISLREKMPLQIKNVTNSKPIKLFDVNESTKYKNNTNNKHKKGDYLGGYKKYKGLYEGNEDEEDYNYNYDDDDKVNNWQDLDKKIKTKIAPNVTVNPTTETITFWKNTQLCGRGGYVEGDELFIPQGTYRFYE